jgi:hypothetical protein
MQVLAFEIKASIIMQGVVQCSVYVCDSSSKSRLCAPVPALLLELVDGLPDFLRRMHELVHLAQLLLRHLAPPSARRRTGAGQACTHLLEHGRVHPRAAERAPSVRRRGQLVEVPLPLREEADDVRRAVRRAVPPELWRALISACPALGTRDTHQP